MFLWFCLWLLFYGCVKIRGDKVNKQNDEVSNKKEHSCNLDDISCLIGPEILSRSGEFYNMLKAKANADKLILLAAVDFAYIDMAINLFETSIKRFHITNFVFICFDNESYHGLQKRGISSFLYQQKVASNVPPRYNTKEFNEKTGVKMKIIAASLMLGFNTMIMDVDIVFLRNPLPHLPLDFDLAIQDDLQVWNFTKSGRVIQGFNGSKLKDLEVLNTGFMLVRPTYAGVDLMHRTLREIVSFGYMDQFALNIVAKRMMDAKSINLKVLDKKKFACGKAYFEEGRHMFGGDMDALKDTYYIVHNNWIETKAAKIYRFKEAGMWKYDGNEYYSSRSRKYVYFTRPVRPTEEVSGLITAMILGRILNRIVILPKFHCYGTQFKVCKKEDTECDLCPFHVHFHVETFEKLFENEYRESEFLRNSKLPNVVKTSFSPEIHFVSNPAKRIKQRSKNKIIINVESHQKAISSNTFISWFGKDSEFGNYSILHFNAINFAINYENKTWWNQLVRSIAHSKFFQQNPRLILI